MIKLNDMVALTVPLSEHKLTIGDVGTVAYCYENSRLYEVEFMNAKGETISVVSLSEEQVRKVSVENIILHVRAVA